MDRRTFLHASAAVVGGATLWPLGCGAGLPAATARRGTAPGIQLYTLRSLMANDFEGTLEQLAEIGYREVETHSYFGRSPELVRGVLDRLGLTSPAAHYGSAALRDDLDAIIDAAGTIGHRYLICPHPGFLPYRTLDDYRAMGDFFSEIGARCAAHGIRFGYHNHQFEFEPIDGEIPMFTMLDEADPDLVVVELDLFWTVHAGYDPVAVIDRYPGRIHAVHVKDRTEGGEMVDVGQGVIDFSRVFARADDAGLQHAFVEHDNPADPMATARAGFAGLTTAMGG
jgi:sugar phosphate isomerase/epimerase